jgi:cytochrome c biogenesis protein CcmG, thiol:disulfide interchange protein DsbE
MMLLRICKICFALKSYLLIGVFSVCLSTVSAQKNIPNVNIQDIKGNQLSAKNILKPNRPTIISFWATWCKPCLQELYSINQNLEDWKKEIDFDFIAISTDDSRSKNKVLSLKNAKKWQFEVFIDENGDLQRAMNVLNIPHTIILDKNHKIIYQHTAYAAGDEEEYFEVLKKLKDLP